MVYCLMCSSVLRARGVLYNVLQSFESTCLIIKYAAAVLGVRGVLHKLQQSLES